MDSGERCMAGDVVFFAGSGPDTVRPGGTLCMRNVPDHGLGKRWKGNVSSIQSLTSQEKRQARAGRYKGIWVRYRPTSVGAKDDEGIERRRSDLVGRQLDSLMFRLERISILSRPSKPRPRRLRV